MTQDVESAAKVVAMKQLSEIYKDDAIKRCSCGSAAFFDCGIELINSAAPYLSPRYQDFADRDHVKICVDCKRAVVLNAGELYDASEYIDRKQIEQYVNFRKSSGGMGPTPGKIP